MNPQRLLFAVVLSAAVVFAPREVRCDPPPAVDRERVERGLKELTDRLARLRADRSISPDHRADAEIYAKAVAWALRYDDPLPAADEAQLRNALERGNERAAALEAGKRPWAHQKGELVRAYVSAVDGSVQPYGVIVPATYDAGRPVRLDVVLHGSSRPVGASELHFLSRFGDAEPPPRQDWIELHPLGRVENGYRWAGETDVFEAIEAVCRNYRIDRDRIVLRGMSMGASGTWHLGLKHPDAFVALGPYCGYVDTHAFSRTPVPGFVPVGPLPSYQEKTLHLLDSIDYAANAGVVPVVACMGDRDVFVQAHVLMGQAMEKEGLHLVNLISRGTGHVIDPATHREQMRRLGEYAARGLDHAPRHLRFVTWTLKYGRCHWLEVLGLGEHYQRAEVEARLGADGSVNVQEPRNVNRLAVRPPALQQPGARLRIAGREVPLPPRNSADPPRTVVVARRGADWVYLGTPESVVTGGKRPGLQGPIDDAFTAPFLCVRGTGPAWNPVVGAWAEARLKQFASEWHRYFRGQLPIKDDTAVTEDDLRYHHLILFGDPGSNRWIARVLPKLPLRWTHDEVRLGDERHPAADHVPVLIQPNPLAAGRYVVLNSGHTFHERELASLNYLLFPRLGDWAVLRIASQKGDGTPGIQGSRPLFATVVRAGFFDEDWKLPAADRGLASLFHPPGDLGSYRSPLKFADGRLVRKAGDWPERRREILRTWHEIMGPWPPLLEHPKIEYLARERREHLTQHHIRLEIAPGLRTDDAYLLIPDGAGPFPAMLVVFYDAATGIGRWSRSPTCDFAYQLARRGFVTLSLGSAPATFYPNKEKAQLQPLSFHAYVAANCHTALASLPQVDAKRIGVMGHSYGGKWALFASCLYQPFACGVWSDPGIVFDETRPNVNYWEPWYLGYEPGRERKPGILTAQNPRTGAYKRLVEAGHDLHELHALMAPRPFLVSGGSEDPPARWKALNHAVAVNALLGSTERVAMSNRPGHSPTAESNALICLFLEHVLHVGRK
jgi:dienelactone hydrolase